MAVCYVSAYHGGSRLKDGMQQLSYSEIYPTLGEKKKNNSSKNEAEYTKEKIF